MCFRSPKAGIPALGADALKPTPVAAPVPMPVPVTPIGEAEPSAEAKRKKLKTAGMQTSIRNVGGSTGISGVGAELSTPLAQGVKTKLGA